MNIKPNVLFILHIPPPVNGAAQMGQYIKESRIVNQEFDADFINLTTSFELLDIGKGEFNKLFIFLKICKNIVKALSGKKYDLCYMTLTAKGIGFYKDFFIVMILKFFNKKIVYHSHNKGVLENSDSTFNRFLYKLVFANTNSILLSPELYADVASYVKEDAVFYCPNGIPDNQPSDIIDKSKEDICKFFFLSNMMETKGVLVLLEACCQLKSNNFKFECHFVGAPSDISRTKFTETVESLEIEECIFFHGKKYGDEKIPFFKNADIFVFPTFEDCFPLVLLEAMQYSLPIISTYEGGIPSIVLNGETGYLVDKGNVTELASMMMKLGSKQELRIKLGKAGRGSFEENFTLEAFEKRIKEILVDIIHNPN